MPLPGCHSIFKGGKHDTGMPKVLDFSSAQPSSFVPEHDFIELLWENGHVVMQGPSNRSKKSSISSLGGKSKEKEAKDAGIPKSVLNTADASECSFEPTGPSGQPILGGQDDDLVPWLNCPLDDYCAEFLPEFSGVSPNPLVPSDRTNAFGQAPRDSHAFENGSSSRPPAGSSEDNRMNNNCSSLHQLFQLPQQFCTLGSPSARPKEPDLMMGAMAEGSGGGDLAAPAKMLKQNIAPSRPMHPNNSNCSSGTTVMNFSHFTRPVALVKANLMGVDRGRGSDRIPTAACSIPVESMAVESAGGLKTFSSPNGHLDLAPAGADPNSVVQVSSEMPVTVQPETNSREEVANDSRNHKKADSPGHRKMVPDNTRSQGASFKAMGLRGAENQHGVSTIASSSVCSAIGGAGSAANDSRSRSKWKCSEGEESECPSEDHEDDSMETRRTATGQSTSKKRSRAAEVHNLSERRRRDRINEKMRALQELIPNCNKVDKASMLDEAIEYLKTLQMQVQMMSMGGGLCMSPMMLHPGVQSMRPPHMTPFSPMAVGMGMGMGFGMGMLDMSRSPLMPLPRMHGPQYPCVSMPTAALHGMPGSANLQMFGMPGQPLPMSMPHPPHFVPLMGMPTAANSAPEDASAAVPEVAAVQASASLASPNSKERQLSGLELVARTSADNKPAESSRQVNEESFELPSIVQMGDRRPPNGGDCKATANGEGIHLPL